MKSIYLLISIFFITPTLHANNSLAIPEVILQTLNECYDNQNNTGITIAKCTLKKLQKMKNPDSYKLNVKLDSFDKKTPTDFTIIISNKNGFLMHCQGIASDKIRIQSCTQKQENTRSTGQELSITPPQ